MPTEWKVRAAFVEQHCSDAFPNNGIFYDLRYGIKDTIRSIHDFDIVTRMLFVVRPGSNTSENEGSTGVIILIMVDTIKQQIIDNFYWI